MKVLDVLSTIGALVMAATPLAVAGMAHAETPVSIQVGDLDFGSRGDVARFDARVTKAADAFCSDVSTADLARRSACVAAVREEATEKLGADQRSQMVATARQSTTLRLATAQ